MFFICRLVAILCFLIALYSGLRDIELYFSEGHYVGITVAQLWKTHAADSFYAFYRSVIPNIPTLHLLIEDALEQTAWVVFLIFSVVIYFICGRRRTYHPVDEDY